MRTLLSRHSKLVIAPALLCASLVCPLAEAAEPAKLGVEPLIGYERVQRVTPSPQIKMRLFSGVRLTYGIPRLSAEAEYIRGTDSDTLPELSQTTSTTDDRLKFGARSSYRLASLLSTWLRLGVQASRTTREVTTGSSSVKTVGQPEYDPYAGAGLNFGLSDKISLDAGVTVVFKNFPDSWDQNDYQASLGFRVRVP